MPTITRNPLRIPENHYVTQTTHTQPTLTLQTKKHFLKCILECNKHLHNPCTLTNSQVQLRDGNQGPVQAENQFHIVRSNILYASKVIGPSYQYLYVFLAVHVCTCTKIHVARRQTHLSCWDLQQGVMAERKMQFKVWLLMIRRSGVFNTHTPDLL